MGYDFSLISVVARVRLMATLFSFHLTADWLLFPGVRAMVVLCSGGLTSDPLVCSHFRPPRTSVAPSPLLPPFPWYHNLHVVFDPSTR